jgi:hypothetical protein
MKHLFLVSMLLVLILLSGCRWDADSLLGNNPGEPAQEIVTESDAYRLCEEQKVVVDRVENAASCATPSDLKAVLAGFYVKKAGVVHFEFRKMWDGTFPKLTRVQYRPKDSTTRIFQLVCELDESQTDLRGYDCELKQAATSGEIPTGSFILAGFDLAHDTCAAKASYKAAFLYDICAKHGNYYWDVTVYWNRERVPEIYRSSASS